MKFGGSSIADADRIFEVKKIVEKFLDKKPVLVFSACFQITNWLIEAGENALNGKVNANKIDFEWFKLKEASLRIDYSSKASLAMSYSDSVVDKTFAPKYAISDASLKESVSITFGFSTILGSAVNTPSTSFQT